MHEYEPNITVNSYALLLCIFILRWGWFIARQSIPRYNLPRAHNFSYSADQQLRRSTKQNNNNNKNTKNSIFLSLWIFYIRFEMTEWWLSFDVWQFAQKDLFAIHFGQWKASCLMLLCVRRCKPLYRLAVVRGTARYYAAKSKIKTSKATLWMNRVPPVCNPFELEYWMESNVL